MRKEKRNGLLPIFLTAFALTGILAEPAMAARRTALLHVGMRILPHGTALPSPAPSTVSLRKAANTETTAGSLRIVIREGDTLTSLARQYYGAPSAYLKILNANREIIRDPDRILPGTPLILPQVVRDPAY